MRSTIVPSGSDVVPGPANRALGQKVRCVRDFPRRVNSSRGRVVDGSTGGLCDVALQHVVGLPAVLLGDDDPGAPVNADLAPGAGVVVGEADLFVAGEAQDDLVQRHKGWVEVVWSWPTAVCPPRGRFQTRLGAARQALSGSPVW